MAMCIHSQEYETCSFGCTMRTATDLKQENEQLKEALGKISEGHPDGNPIFLIEIAKHALKTSEKVKDGK